MIKELVDIYLASKGLRRITGKDNDASPLLPLIMMDSAYQLFLKYIKPIPCRQEMKKAKSDWLREYTLFNKEFFSCYNLDQTLFLTDMMDAFEDFIKEDIEKVFGLFCDLFPHETKERAEVLSACLLANIHCQCAELVFERIFKNSQYRDKTDHRLLACRRLLTRWKDLYYGNNILVNPNESEPIAECVGSLCRKQVEFLNTYL